MSKKQKLVDKFYSKPAPSDFTWEELITMMKAFNFKATCAGGSHYTFEHKSGFKFSVSKTHPSGLLKRYQIGDAKEALNITGEHE